MKCKNCAHWKRDPMSDQFLPEDEFGECEGLLGGKVEIELKTGWDGGYVDRIETNRDFFCANYKELEKSE